MSYDEPSKVLYSNTEWTTLSLLNGWQGFAGYGTPRCRKINDIVYVQGLVQSGSGIIATLPAKFWPDRQLIFSVTTNPNVIGRIDIDSTGNITPYKYDPGWLSLCVSFVSDQ